MRSDRLSPNPLHITDPLPASTKKEINTANEF